MSTTNPRRITSDWDDIHRRLGNFAPLEKEEKSEEISQRNIEAAENFDVRKECIYGGKEVIETEEDGGTDFDDVLAAYRIKRLEELKKSKMNYRFGSLRHIGKADFLREVTEASKVSFDEDGKVVNESKSEAYSAGTGIWKEEDKILSGGYVTSGSSWKDSDRESERQSSNISKNDSDLQTNRHNSKHSKTSGTYVITHLYSDEMPFCTKMNEILSELAKKFGSIKFVYGKVQDILPKFPSHQLPLVLIYKNGACSHQIFGTKIWGDLKINSQIVEFVLAKQFQVMHTDIQEDPRPSKNKFNDNTFNPSTFYATKNKFNESDDDDEEDDDDDGRGYSSLNIDRKKSLLRKL